MNCWKPRIPHFETENQNIINIIYKSMGHLWEISIAQLQWEPAGAQQAVAAKAGDILAIRRGSQDT